MQSLSKEIINDKNEEKEKKEIDKSILYNFFFFSFPALSFFELFYAPVFFFFFLHFCIFSSLASLSTS